MRIFVNDKVLWHGDKLYGWRHGDNPFPVTVEIDLIGACNSHCPRCAGGEMRGRLPLDRVKKLLEEFAVHEVRGVIFTGGGEPTLHSDLSEALEHTALLGMDAAVITNGLQLSESQIRSIVSHCCWVRVSLDAGDAYGYKHSHGGTSEEFTSVWGNIAALVDMKKQLGSSCTIGVGYLVDNELIPGMEQAAISCAQVGVDYIQFRPFYIGKWFNGPGSVNYDAYRASYNLASRHATETCSILHSGPKFDKIASGDIGRGYKVCHAQQFCGVVTATGDVALCCVLRGQEKFVLGNIFENSFAEIWASDRRKSVCANLNIARDCPPLCRGDAINELLAAQSDRPTHVNFL